MLDRLSTKPILRWLTPLAVTGAVALVALTVVVAQQAPTNGPEPTEFIPGPSDPHPPGKPEYPQGATPTPDPAIAPALSFCAKDATLCAGARELGASVASGDTAALGARLAATTAQCGDPNREPATCVGKPGTEVSGFTVSAKQAIFLGRAEFEVWLASAFRHQSGKAAGGIRIAAVGCAVSTTEDPPDCSQFAAVSFQISDEKGMPSHVVVLFLLRGGEGGVGLIGGAITAPQGSVVTGGVHREFVAGWVGRPTNGFWFEPISP